MPGLSGNAGSVVFLAVLHGSVDPMKLTLRDISQAGVDGHAYIDIGVRGMPYGIFTVVDLDNAVALALEKVVYAGMVGSLVTLVDGMDNVWYDQLVLDVKPLRELRLYQPVGGISTYAGAMLMARWWLQATSY